MRLCIALAFLPLAGCFFVSDGDDSLPYCGDGIIDTPVGETCDDGNSIAGDGCTACRIDPVAGDAYITASWQLKNIATNTPTACPVGFDTAAVYSQPVDASGNNAGPVVIDLFDCAATTGTTAPLVATRYLSWIEIVDHNNTALYAKSLSAYVDVTLVDASFSAQILNDGGYFQMQWALVGGTSSASLTCAQAGAVGGVEAVATDVSTPSNTASDIFSCEDASGITAGFLAATYTISVAALDAADQSIGTAPALTNRVINVKNAVTNLGTVTIPITGL